MITNDRNVAGAEIAKWKRKKTATKAEMNGMIIKLPEAKLSENPTDTQREVVEQYNKLAGALKWFFANGVSINLRTTATGYNMTLSNGLPRRRKGAKS